MTTAVMHPDDVQDHRANEIYKDIICYLRTPSPSPQHATAIETLLSDIYSNAIVEDVDDVFDIQLVREALIDHLMGEKIGASREAICSARNDLARLVSEAERAKVGSGKWFLSIAAPSIIAIQSHLTMALECLRSDV